MELCFLFHNLLTRENTQLEAVHCGKYSPVTAAAVSPFSSHKGVSQYFFRENAIRMGIFFVQLCIIKVPSPVNFAWSFSCFKVNYAFAAMFCCLIEKISLFSKIMIK